MNESLLEDGLSRAVAFLSQAQRALALTGHGLSAGSGVPAMDGASGLWQVIDRECLSWDAFLAGPAGRARFWRSIGPLSRPIARAAPTAAHRALATMFTRGRISWIITQNIDGLHQRAGIPPDRVIELEGNDRFVDCLQCGKRFPREVADKQVAEGNHDPRCFLCQGPLKPAIVFFGEKSPEPALLNAFLTAQHCDLVLVAGAGLDAPPSAYIPPLARRCGARIVMVSEAATPHDAAADVALNGDIGRILNLLLAGLLPPRVTSKS